MKNKVICKLTNKPCIYQQPDDPECNVFCPVYTWNIWDYLIKGGKL